MLKRRAPSKLAIPKGYAWKRVSPHAIAQVGIGEKIRVYDEMGKLLYAGPNRRESAGPGERTAQLLARDLGILPGRNVIVLRRKRVRKPKQT